MTVKNNTKLLAILAVTALALVPVFALIDSADSSASGEHDINVGNWDEFKKTMNDARAAPEDTFNVKIASASGIISIRESITIPANVNLEVPERNTLFISEAEVGSSGATLINEGAISLNPHEEVFGEAGGIAVAGNGITFINKNTITAKLNSSLVFTHGANFINDGRIVSDMWNFNFMKSGGLTNNGEIVLNQYGSCLLIQLNTPFVNWGTVSGEGAIIVEQSPATNLGIITCRVLGEMKQETAIWDTSKAGRTISSEGYNLNVKDSDINEALKKLGDRTVEDIVQEAINSSLGGIGSTKISDITVNLEQISNFAEAEYPNNIILRTAFFKVNVGTKVEGKFTAQLPDAGVYSFNDTPTTSEKTVGFESTIRLEGLLRINAYFDAGEKLQRVDIILGVGLNTSTDAGLELSVDKSNKKYSIDYSDTSYIFGTGITIAAGLDFNGFDLFSYNPGDKWDVTGTVKVAGAKGHIDLTANGRAVDMIEYMLIGDETEYVAKLCDEIRDKGKATIDLTELFDLLFGSAPTNAPVTKSVSGAAMVPVDASAAVPANGLFDSFMFTASASMGEDGYVTLTRGPASTGSIDIGEIIFDRLEEEGETAIEVNSEISGDSMTTLFTGTVAVLTGASQEDINGVLKDLGANYTESYMSVSEMDRICDRTMRDIDKMGGRDDSNNTTLYVMIGLIAALAALIAIPMFIRRN